MSSQANPIVFNLPSSSPSTLSYQAFLVIFLAVAFSSILIVLYTDTIKNLFYNTLGINNQSAWNALLVALLITGVFILLVYLITSYDLLAASQETTAITGGFPPGANSLMLPTSTNTSLQLNNNKLNNNKLNKTKLTNNKYKLNNNILNDKKNKYKKRKK